MLGLDGFDSIGLGVTLGVGVGFAAVAFFFAEAPFFIDSSSSLEDELEPEEDPEEEEDEELEDEPDDSDKARDTFFCAFDFAGDGCLVFVGGNAAGLAFEGSGAAGFSAVMIVGFVGFFSAGEIESGFGLGTPVAVGLRPPRT